MKFDLICENIAVKNLGKSGLFVECMKDHMNDELSKDYLEKGAL